MDVSNLIGSIERMRSHLDKHYWKGEFCQKHQKVKLYHMDGRIICGECDLIKDQKAADNYNYWWCNDGQQEAAQREQERREHRAEQKARVKASFFKK